jgi:hypothetical protein
MAYSSTNEINQPMPSLHARLLRSVTEMLGEQNGCAPESYTWVHERWAQAPIAELVALQAGWQRSQPETFSRHGIYVL